ncbi:MAG: lysophospholipid acyltransferase family protein [Isosphaeraceae bacterium]
MFIRRRLRKVLSWKFVFYDRILPVLRWLGPARGDRILGLLGRIVLAILPRRRAQLRAALRDAGSALDADWPMSTTWPALVSNTARFLARDYPLDQQSDEAILARFDVRGYERLQAAMAGGRGAILVGSHLGAHIAGVHWLYRRGVPLRLLVQRPRHVSRELDRRFDQGGPHPQAELFLRRDLSPTVAVERVLRARSALRDGMAIYLNGDIPWTGPNTCPGRLLGRPHRLLAIWTELAVLTHAPVFLVFCTHAPGGRFALEFEPMGWLRPGEEQAAVFDYLKQLESRIANSPADAVAHLIWPCYAPRPSSKQETHSARARRRKVISSRS